MVTFLGLSGVDQFWKSKVKEALTAATLLLFFCLSYQLKEQNRGNIISPRLRMRYLALFLISYTTLGRSHVSSCSLL